MRDPITTTTPEHPRGALLRAYDKISGAQVGAKLMPAPQSGNPMTYVVDGKQSSSSPSAAAANPANTSPTRCRTETSDAKVSRVSACGPSMRFDGAGMSAATIIRAIFCAGAMFAAALTSTHAADYTGKQLTIVIGYGVGGTYSQYAQLFAHHIGRFLPGSPAVVVQSMPGAGGVRMLNEAAVRMRADGATIFVPPDTMVTTQLLETSGVAYDARKFHYIGTADQQNTFWAVRRPAGTSVAELKSREVFMGHSGKGSTGYMIPAIAKPLLGLKVKVIGGYEGSRDTILAMEKGEIDGTVQAWQAWLQARPAWFTGANGYGVPLLQVGVTPDPDAPPVPLLSDLVAKEDRPIVALFDTIGLLGRGLAAPPGTPADYVEALRKAFNAMMSDADYRAEAQKTQLRVLPKTGEELQKAISAAIDNVNPATIERARGFLN
jgi:tripartite-type tricarboxylate transporter receptor subunit TctC